MFVSRAQVNVTIVNACAKDLILLVTSEICFASTYKDHAVVCIIEDVLMAEENKARLHAAGSLADVVDDNYCHKPLLDTE
jgi:hypothetical protein